MIVKKIELKNWGPHKSLSADTDAPVVGILGPNGTGKTNILEALQFAWTGLLDRPQEKYVRRSYAEDKPIKNGSVTIEFNKDGAEGRIFRQVGASPKRRLEWDGKTYTAMRDVDAVLRDVLDCDRKAISMAVFLSQGRIGDFLFATPAERERLMASLCLVDHLPKVADIIDQQLTDVRRLVANHEESLDEVREQLRSSEASVSHATSRLNESTDYTSSINWLREVLSKKQRVFELVETRTSRQGDLDQAKIKLDLLKKPEVRDSKDLEDLRGKLEAQEKASLELDKINNSIKYFEVRSSALEQATKSCKECWEAAEGLWEAEKQVRLIREKLDVVSRIQEAKSAADQALAELDRCNSERESLTLQHYSLKAKMAEAARREEEAHARIQELGFPEDVLRVRVSLLKDLVDKVSGPQTCPVCNQGSLSGSEILQDDLNKASAYLENLDSSRWETYKVESDYLRSTVEVQKANSRVGEAGSKLRRYNLAVEEATPKDGVPVVNREDYHAAIEKRATLQKAASGLQALESQVEELRKELKELAPEGIERLRSQGQELNLKLLSREEVADIRQKISDSEIYLRSWEKLNQDVDRAQSRLSEAVSEHAKVQGQLDSLLKHRPASVSQFDEDWEEALRVLQQKQARRHEMQGELNQAVKAFRGLENRLEEIKGKIAGQARIVEVISDLERLKSAFGRHGIQKHYLVDLFSVLSGLTRSNLTAWEADFSVKEDPDQPLNFLFSRAEEPEIWLDQSQLSGGQRVRLSISFLLAVQQLIFPELNFMVLDEPSTHLDTEGVEGLHRLFGAMANSLQSLDAQVFVVDHHEGLHSAFSKTVRLESWV